MILSTPQVCQINIALKLSTKHGAENMYIHQKQKKYFGKIMIMGGRMDFEEWVMR